MKCWILAELMMQMILNVVDYNEWFWALLAENEILLLIEAFSAQDSEYCKWWYHMIEIKNLENMIWSKQFYTLSWMLKSQTCSLSLANTHHHQLMSLSTDIAYWQHDMIEQSSESKSHHQQLEQMNNDYDQKILQL